MEYEIKVIVPNAEAQMEFCNKLASYGFHWLSGQKADEIPALLRLTGELGQILILNLLERKITFFPIELYGKDKKTAEEIFKSCISVEDALQSISDIVAAKFTSVWDGGTEITTKCKVNLRTHQILDIETVDVEVGSLDYQYVTIYGKEFVALNANEEDDIDSSTDYWFE